MKKLTSIFLVLMLVLSLLPVGVLAQEGEEALDSAEQSDTLLAESDTDEPVEEVAEASTENTEETGAAVENTEEIAALSLDGVDADAATSGDCGADGDNLKWTLDEGGKLTITGTGAMANYAYASDAPWYAHYSSGITSVEIGDGVTSIGWNAFSGCRLVSVTIADSVAVIGSMAFYQCYGLESIKLPASLISIGVNAFLECTSLESVEIPAKVEAIGNAAFASCSSLTNIAVSEDSRSYKSIDGVLFDKGKTTLIQYPAGKQDKSYTIPSTVTSIKGGAFMGCSRLTSVTIPYSVTKIGMEAFLNCEALESVTLSDFLTEIAEYTFSGCSSLKTVVIPEGVSYLLSGAFYRCNALESVTIPSSVTKIENQSFAVCTSLADVYYAASRVDWEKINIDTNGNKPLTGAKIHFSKSEEGTGIVDSGDYGDDLHWTLDGDGKLTISGTGEVTRGGWTASSVTSVVIGEGVTSLGSWAFDFCTKLTSVSLPSTLTTIKKGAFSNCFKLKTLTIPASVTSIDSAMFFRSRPTAVNVDAGNEVYCSVDGVVFSKDMTEIVLYPGDRQDKSYTIPASVTKIGDRAFFGAENLESFVVPDGVVSIGNDAFGGCIAMKHITLGSGVTSIGDAAFNTSMQEAEGFDSVLESITVAADNTAYCSVDGVVFSKDNKTLVQYPAGKLGASYTIPSSVTSIGSNAFAWGRYLTSMTIPSGVTSIGSAAFNGCSMLTSVTIPLSVKNIENLAFGNCILLTDVYYAGSETQWDEVGGKDIVEIELEKATVHFGSTEPVAEVISGDYGDDLHWTLDGDGKLTISGTGTMQSYPLDAPYEGGVPWYEHRGKIKTVVIEDGVPNIGDFAFYQCAALTSVTIPSSVTAIENSSFEGCTALASITIPNSVKEIGNGAFSRCASLASIWVGNGLTIIGDSAFVRCSNLADVYYAGVEADWNSIAVYGANDELDKATKHFMSEEAEAEIVDSGDCGANGDNLTWTLDVNGKLIISGKGKMADYEAYGPWHTKDSPKGEVNVRIVVIEVGVTSIGKNAFRDCRLIASVTIPETVTSIGEAAFYDCNSLASVTIPASVTSIGDFAFANYGIEIGGLVSITVVSGNKNYHSDGGVLFNKNMTILLQYPTGKRASSYTIPSGVTSIGTYAFAGSNALASVTIPSSVKRIDEGAFSECSALTSVTFPSGVTSIGDFMFSGCGALTNLTIPSGVTSIGKYAFIGCDLLERVTIPASVTSIGESAFYLADALTDVYFTGSVTQWNEINPGGDNDPLANAAKHYGAQIKEDGSTSVTTVTEDKETGTKATTETTLVGDKTTNVTTTETKNAAGETTTTVTKNVTDKANNVTTETKVNDNKRAETKAEFGEGGKTPSRVTVDATAPNPKDVTGAEVKLPAKALKEAAQEETGKVEQVELKTDIATVTINNDALKTMTEGAEENEELILAVDKTDKTTDTDKGVYATYELTAKIGNEDVFKERNEEDNGFVTISVRYTLTNASYDVMVYYVDEQGQRHDMNARFEGGILTWATSHFSTFEVVEQAKSAQPDTKPDDAAKPAAKTTDAKKPPRTGDESHAAMWLAVALLGGCAVVGTTLVAKKKNYNQ